MREETIILRDLIGRPETSVYDLAKTYASERNQLPEETFEEFSRILYLLAGKGLVSLRTVKGTDGVETMAVASDLAGIYLKTNELLE